MVIRDNKGVCLEWVRWRRLLMKPGKPLTFATIRVDETCKPMLVFALPGNPVSSAVTFNLVVAPVLRALCGFDRPQSGTVDTHQRIRAKLAQRLHLDRARPEYHRAKLVWSDKGVGSQYNNCCWLAYSTGNQISSKLTNMVGANALIELPQGIDGGRMYMDTGDDVSCILIGSWPQNINNNRVLDDTSSKHTLEEKSRQEDNSNSISIIRIGIATISDRASTGVYNDISGPAIVSYMDAILNSTALNSIDPSDARSHLEELSRKRDCADQKYHKYLYLAGE